MALTARMEVRQGQGLVLTPQLQQAIKLLAYSGAELDAFVEGELGSNPLLEREEAESPAEMPEPEREDAVEREFSGGEDFAETAGAVDARADDIHADAGASDGAQPGLNDWSRVGAGGGGEDGGDWEQDAARERTLHEHLHDQLALAGFDAVERGIADTLIDLVDEGGYLRTALAEVADRLGCAEARVEGVLLRLQGFEPTGVFARSLPECLALQLRERNRFDPAMAALVENLALLARRDMAGLRSVCGVDAEDLAEMVAEL